MRFEWDDKKARENLKTHGVTFGEATEVFYDPYALEAYDIEHSTIEARFFIIGLSSRRLLYVVYAERIRCCQNNLGAQGEQVGVARL